MALEVQTLIDPRTGRIVNPNLAEYHVPVHADLPHIDVDYLDEPDPTMPLGLLGLGEIGITGAPAAIANGVRQATGKRIVDLPITLDKAAVRPAPHRTKEFRSCASWPSKSTTSSPG